MAASRKRRTSDDDEPIRRKRRRPVEDDYDDDAGESDDPLDMVIDFNKEEGGQSSFRPGDYAFRIVKAIPTRSSEKETPGTELTLAFTEDKRYKGKKIRDTLWLTPKSLFRYRQVLEALGEEYPDKLTVRKFITIIKNGELGAEVFDREYNGNTYSNVKNYMSLDDLENDEDFDDDSEDDDDDILDDEDDDVTDDDEDEFTDEDDDELDEDEEAEEEKPRRRRAASKSRKAPPKAAPKKPVRRSKNRRQSMDLDDY